MPPTMGLTSFVAGLEGFTTKLVSPVIKLVGFIAGLEGFATKLVSPVIKLVGFIAGLEGFATKLVSPVTKLVSPIIKLKGLTLNFLILIINSMNKVVIDISHKGDDEISTTVGAAIAGITGNSSFTMVAQLAALVTAKGAYDPALAACAHGNEADTTTKNTKKALLVAASNCREAELLVFQRLLSGGAIVTMLSPRLPPRVSTCWRERAHSASSRQTQTPDPWRCP